MRKKVERERERERERKRGRERERTRQIEILTELTTLMFFLSVLLCVAVIITCLLKRFM